MDEQAKELTQSMEAALLRTLQEQSHVFGIPQDLLDSEAAWWAEQIQAWGCWRWREGEEPPAADPAC